MNFDALAFPWMVYSHNGDLVLQGDGSLFELPTIAGQPSQLQFYKSIKRTGWNKCPLGYAVYSKSLAEFSTVDPSILIIPGLKVRGISTVTGKREGFHIVAASDDIEQHVETVLSSEEKIRERYDLSARENIHEIRGINSGLYHAAHELLQIVQRDLSTYKHANNLAFNVVALSQTITARLDLISYLTDPQLSTIGIGEVSVFQKFDKIVRALKPAAQNNRKDMQLSGSSFAVTYGPKGLMEVIAYLLIDNALKYSPENQPIRIGVTENDRSIFVEVSSVGSKIEEAELQLIFQRGYRTKTAISSGRSGSGLGLNALVNLVQNSFDGTVSASCGKHILNINSLSYHEICFSVTFPITRKR